MIITLEGKRALVTGGNSGIGAAIALALAEAGAKVAVNYVGHPEAADALVQTIKQKHGEAISLQADVSDPQAVGELFRQMDKAWGGIDILINNAGIQVVAPIEDFPPEKWDAVLAINLSSAFHTIRAATPGMKAQKWGRIVNTASAHSLVASPFKSAYVAAKHGLAGLTKTVALELATFGVTCNCISPGYVWTPLVENQIPETMKARNLTRDQVINDVLLHAQPTKQFVTSEQVAALAVYLCSDNAAQITGANLSIDGGWTAE